MRKMFFDIFKITGERSKLLLIAVLFSIILIALVLFLFYGVIPLIINGAAIFLIAIPLYFYHKNNGCKNKIALANMVYNIWDFYIIPQLIILVVAITVPYPFSIAVSLAIIIPYILW